MPRLQPKSNGTRTEKVARRQVPFGDARRPYCVPFETCAETVPTRFDCVSPLVRDGPVRFPLLSEK